MDLIRTALADMRARPVRALLLSLGPALGVAAVIAALGLSTSATAQLQTALNDLGADLMWVSSGGNDSTQRLPVEAAARARAQPGVVSAAPLTVLSKVSVARSGEVDQNLDVRSLQVVSTDQEMMKVGAASLAWGRFLTEDDASLRSVVLGAESARRLGILDWEVRSVLVGGKPFAVVGVLRPVGQLPVLDTAVLVTRDAGAVFDPDPAPTFLIVRTEPGAAQSLSASLDLAITYGYGSPVSVSIPTGLLAARAEVDTTMQLVIISMGALAMIIGGVGIANVMTISVIQRTAEIGLRRALGHRRTTIAGQFLLQAFLVGTGGSLAGVGIGVAAVAVAAARNGWSLSIDPATATVTLAISLMVCLLAGSYPAIRAARLEPALALRS
ncbi:MAG: ABC transporter permease [Actinomycetales bacterium]